MSKFKPCPFCGKEVAEYEKSEDDYSFPLNQYTVICNAINGGCGATCGYNPSKIEARKKWNRRTEDRYLKDG